MVCYAIPLGRRATLTVGLRPTEENRRRSLAINLKTNAIGLRGTALKMRKRRGSTKTPKIRSTNSRSRTAEHGPQDTSEGSSETSEPQCTLLSSNRPRDTANPRRTLNRLLPGVPASIFAIDCHPGANQTLEFVSNKIAAVDPHGARSSLRDPELSWPRQWGQDILGSWFSRDAILRGRSPVPLRSSRQRQPRKWCWRS